jgi:hypothetical protein
MDQNLAEERDLLSVSLKRSTGGKVSRSTLKITDIGWFNDARASAELPTFTPGGQEDDKRGESNSEGRS